MQRNLFILICLLCCQTGWCKDFVWYDGTKPVTYAVQGGVSPVVTVAVDMFAEDLRQVTGKLPEKVSAAKATVRIVQLDGASKRVKAELRALGVPVGELEGKRDGFYMVAPLTSRFANAENPPQRGTNNSLPFGEVDGAVSPGEVGGAGTLLVVGSDGRGTAYGVLELSRLAGVSPWVWWGDAVPEKRDRLTLPEGFRTLQSPSVEYRGIFINDEDWSLQPWSWQTFEPSEVKGRIGARTYKEVFKLLLRLRANMIWPAMHGSTTPFYLVPGAKEAADSCGIVIGTSHCEPLMRNNVGEWDAARRGAYNYITNRDSVQAYWTERLREVKQYENIYTLGMRGIHDGSMEGVHTLQEKTAALQQVIDDQRKLLAKYVSKEVTEIPQAFVPYKEVLDIMENGLRVPEDVTLMWCDDNYGYMTRLSDGEQQKRSGGAGVYYHLSYWGRPHDYLWLCTTQPGLIYNEMRQAYDHNARKVWIVNVHEPRIAAYGLELFLDMAWNIDTVSPSTLNNHLERWLCREFGHEAGRKLLPAMLEYYRLCAIRKPEFMGWTQVELDRNIYPRGRSQVRDTEFSLTEFGGELDRYLQDYQAVKQTVTEVERSIPDGKKDTYFSFVKYPVCCAAAMSVKMLEAQRARSYSMGQVDETLWTRNEPMLAACARSMEAYQEIRRLTDYYNNELAGGKWKGSMLSNPRDLYVFYPPLLPEVAPLTSCFANAENPPKGGTNNSFPFGEVGGAVGGIVGGNACDYSRASEPVSVIQSLGHSMNAVSLPRGASISFDFETDFEGEAVLRTAVIPTQPNDKGDIRISIRIDDGEPQVRSFREKGRTETWKQNVLRGQARIETKHVLNKGKHTLTIKALDNHVLIDQWMVDPQPDRKFYLFPVSLSKQ